MEAVSSSFSSSVKPPDWGSCTGKEQGQVQSRSPFLIFFCLLTFLPLSFLTDTSMRSSTVVIDRISVRGLPEVAAATTCSPFLTYWTLKSLSEKGNFVPINASVAFLPPKTRPFVQREAGQSALSPDSWCMFPVTRTPGLVLAVQSNSPMYRLPGDLPLDVLRLFDGEMAEFVHLQALSQV